jgi:hypothetical protein
MWKFKMDRIEAIPFETKKDLQDVNEIVEKINLKIMSHGEEGNENYYGLISNKIQFML